MKKIELYACEICGTQYAEMSRARECETNHKRPISVTATYDTPITMNKRGYPGRVTVLFDNGTEVTYRR
jgi:hypothetical protein